MKEKQIIQINATENTLFALSAEGKIFSKDLKTNGEWIEVSLPDTFIPKDRIKPLNYE